MADIKRADAFLRASVFPVLLLVFLLQAIACRGMYADGANFFLKLLETGTFPWYDYQRMTNHILVEGPTWLALRLGLHDLVALRYLFSASELFLPLLVWGSALWSLRRDVLFWPFVTLFCFVYYGTNFFAIGEYNLCYALVGYCLAMLLKPPPDNSCARASLLIAAALLPMEYASTLFLGSFLLAVSIVKPQQECKGATIYRMALRAFFLASAASALWEILAPRDPTQFAASRNIAFLILNKQFWCVLGFCLATAGLHMVKKPWLRGTLTILCAVLLMRLVLDKARLHPFFGYGVRAYTGATFAVLGCGLWWFNYYGIRLVKKLETPLLLTPAIFSLILFLTVSAFDMNLSLDYGDYLETFRADVNNHTGLVPYEKSGLMFLPGDDRFKWGWTYPLMSVILRDNSGKAIILNPHFYKDYQPFDPATQVPDLDYYYR